MSEDRIEYCPVCDGPKKVVYDYPNKDKMLDCDHIIPRSINEVSKLRDDRKSSK